MSKSDLIASTSRIFEWKKRVYNELVCRYGNKINSKKWGKICYTFYMEYYNINFESPKAKDVLEDVMLRFQTHTAIKFGVTKEEIDRIFRSIELKEGDYPLISIETMCKEVPDKIARKLINYAGQEEFEMLVLRYYVIGFSQGLFLSIDRDVYQAMYRSSKLPTIEGYASPFNSNLENFCSLFYDDGVYGSLGKFEEYIPQLKTNARLCVNPPYVNSVMGACINVLIDYMKRCRGEFIGLFPLMNSFEPMERLLSFGNTRYVLLEGGSYTIFNFLCGKDIVAPMKLYIICNIENNSIASQKCANDIAYFLRKKAERITETMS